MFERLLVRIAAALVKHKIPYMVIGGQIEDVESILLKNPAFDAGYIRSWLREFDRALDGKIVAIFAALVRRVRSRR